MTESDMNKSSWQKPACTHFAHRRESSNVESASTGPGAVDVDTLIGVLDQGRCRCIDCLCFWAPSKHILHRPSAPPRAGAVSFGAIACPPLLRFNGAMPRNSYIREKFTQGAQGNADRSPLIAAPAWRLSRHKAGPRVDQKLIAQYAERDRVVHPASLAQGRGTKAPRPLFYRLSLLECEASRWRLRFRGDRRRRFMRPHPAAAHRAKRRDSSP
jgi:hypothetical protein